MPTYIVNPSAGVRTVDVRRSITSLPGIDRVYQSDLTGAIIVEASERSLNSLRQLDAVASVEEDIQFTPDLATQQQKEEFLRIVREDPEHDPLLPEEPSREDGDTGNGRVRTDGAGTTGPGGIDAELDAVPTAEGDGTFSNATECIEYVNAKEAADNGKDGEGVISVIVDTGICDGQVADTRKFGGLDTKDETDPWDDYYGHGSFTYGIMAGGAGTSGIEQGCAPASDVFAVRSGLAASELIRAQDKIAEIAKETGRPVVVNNSYGTGQCGGLCNRTFNTAVNEACKIKNVFQAFSAGNAATGDGGCGRGCGDNGISSASALGSVMTVGAVGLNGNPDRIMPYSSRGGKDVCGNWKPDVSAPMYGTVPWGCGSDNKGNAVGTSGTTPVVAGAMAQALTGVTAEEIPTYETASLLPPPDPRPGGERDLLYRAVEQSCSDITEPGSVGWDGCTGYGRFDAKRTVDNFKTYSFAKNALFTRGTKSAALAGLSVFLASVGGNVVDDD